MGKREGRVEIPMSAFFGRQDKPGDPFGFEKIIIRENVGSKQLSKTMGSP